MAAAANTIIHTSSKLSRRAVLGGAAASIAAGGAAHGAMPAQSQAAELIADWKWASAAYEEVADRLEEIEHQHPEVTEHWCEVDIGFNGQFGHIERFPLGIEDTFKKQFVRLREAYGENDDVENAIRALDRLRLRAQADLDRQWTEWKRDREACGLAAVEREAKIAADRERACFQAILDYRPASPEEAAERSGFLLEFTARWPADPKVSDIREALFG